MRGLSTVSDQCNGILHACLFMIINLHLDCPAACRGRDLPKFVQLLLCTSGTLLPAGDVGDIPVVLIWPVLKVCNAEELAAIEDATR